MYPSPITYPSELTIGDHILFLIPHSEPPLRPLYQSALVTGAEKENIEIVSYSRPGIYWESVKFGSFKHLHKVEYTRCRYSGNRAVSRARWRLKSGEDHYHALYNNSHFFVAWAKTGNEFLMHDVINGLAFDGELYIALSLGPSKCVEK